MVRDVITLESEDTIAKAYSIMESKKISQVPVVDSDKRYSGMIYAKQLISSSAQPTSKLKSFVVNTTTASPDSDVEKAAQLVGVIARSPFFWDGNEITLSCSIGMHEFHGQQSADQKRHQRVPQMRNGGIGQDTLDVGLQQRQQISAKHRQDRHDGNQVPEDGVPFEIHGDGQAKEQRKNGGFGAGRHECRNGSGSALIDIRRPHMEGRDAQFESDSDQNKPEGSQDRK